jgi:hypothetical protein
MGDGENRELDEDERGHAHASDPKQPPGGCRPRAHEPTRRRASGRLGMIVAHASGSGGMNEWLAFGIVVVICGVLAWLVNLAGDDGDSDAGDRGGG